MKTYHALHVNQSFLIVIITRGFCYSKTQFEIERRSYGQSMTYFRFFSCGGQKIFTGCHSFFMCLVRNLQKKWKKCPKSFKLWLCIRYCTDKLTLGHVRLYDRFLEVMLKHLGAIQLKSEFTTYSYFLKVGLKCDLVFELKCI